MVARLLTLLTVGALSVAACTSLDSRPTQFEDMTSDEVGCTVLYGESDRYTVGPLGPSDAEEIHPNDYTMFRVARTASDIMVVVEQADGGGYGPIPLNHLPADGIVARGPFRDGGNPGYIVTCWRGAD